MDEPIVYKCRGPTRRLAEVGDLMEQNEKRLNSTGVPVTEAMRSEMRMALRFTGCGFDLSATIKSLRQTDEIQFYQCPACKTWHSARVT